MSEANLLFEIIRLGRERDDAVNAQRAAEAERDAAVDAYLATGEVKLTNASYNTLIRNMVQLTYDNAAAREWAAAWKRAAKRCRAEYAIAQDLLEQP